MVLWRAGCPGPPAVGKAAGTQTGLLVCNDVCRAQPWVPAVRARVQQQKQLAVPCRFQGVYVWGYIATAVRQGGREEGQAERGGNKPIAVLVQGVLWRATAVSRQPVALCIPGLPCPPCCCRCFPGAHPQAAGQWVADGLVDTCGFHASEAACHAAACLLGFAACHMLRQCGWK